MNAGKSFEKDLIASLPDNILHIRLQDAGGWSKSDTMRFTVKNICDFILFDGNVLCPCELKSHKGKSLPLSCIRQNQIDGLSKLAKYKNTYPALIVNFRDINETYILHINTVVQIIDSKTSKSIPLSYFKQHGFVIPQALKRTHFSYDVKFMFECISNNK